MNFVKLLTEVRSPCALSNFASARPSFQRARIRASLIGRMSSML
jgi:hypothetical protein